MKTLAMQLLPVRIVAVVTAAGFGAIALFQATLALGAPLGRAAWGGAHVGTLPVGLRIASAVAAVFWAFAAVLVLERAGIHVVWLPGGLVRWGPWALVAILVVGALMNLASPSAWERFLWGPVALLLAGLTLVVVRTHGAS
jgi:hypothetical protein